MQARHCSILFALSIVLTARSALAHRPHDVVGDLVLAPDYPQTGQVFIAAENASPPRRNILLRSFDDGLSWSRIANGLDLAGDVRTICTSPQFAFDDTMFVTTETEGVYRSTDGGLSFQPASTGLFNKTMASSACGLDGLSSFVMLVAHTGGGLSRSTNLGQTWSLVLGASVLVDALALSPEFTLDGTALVGTASGQIMASADFGATWVVEQQVVPVNEIEHIDIPAGFPGAQLRFVATTSQGILGSSNFGQSYQSLSACLPALPMVTIVSTPSFAVDQTLFAAAAQKGVYVSHDAGVCWTLSDIPLQAANQTTRDFEVIVPSPGYATDQTVYVAMFDGVFRSTDAGQTWFELDAMGPANYERFSVSPSHATDATVGVVRYGGGVATSSNGGTSWTIRNTGLGQPYTRDFVFSPNYAVDKTVFTAYDRFVPKSTTGGQSWTEGAECLPGKPVIPGDVAISPNFKVDKTLFLASRTQGILRTTNAGTSWSQVNATAGFVHSFAISPGYATDKTVFAGRPTSVDKSTNGGTSWVKASSGLVSDARGPQLVISSGFLTDKRLYAATLNGLYQTVDAGTSWTVLPVATLRSNSPVECVAISPAFATDKTLIASVRGKGLWRSTNSGTSFTQVGTNLIQTNVEINWMEFSPTFATDKTVYGVSEDRMFKSVNQGVTWVEIARGPVRSETDVATLAKKTGTWVWRTQTGASTRSVMTSSTAGSRIDYHFVGSRAAFIGAKGPTLGIYDVYVDDVLEGSVDQYSATSTFQVNGFTTAVLPLGVHKLSIVVTTKKNPAASGNAVYADAFDRM